MAKGLETTAKILAGVGAANWGTSQFLKFDVLSFAPGIWNTIAVLAITASGAMVVYWTIKKKI